MITGNPFEENAVAYDRWYDENSQMLKSEIAAVSSLFHLAETEYRHRTGMENLKGLEIGVGSGRFAAALGIGTGIDPSPAMLEIAAKHGINVCLGKGEALPFAANRFDYTAFFTSVCFLDDPVRSFMEAERVTKSSGFLLCSFLDRESPAGKVLQEHKSEDPYYKDAVFHSGTELLGMLTQTGFGPFMTRQVFFDEIPPSPADAEPQNIREGLGEGLYGVILAWKTQQKKNL